MQNVEYTQLHQQELWAVFALKATQAMELSVVTESVSIFDSIVLG